MTHVLVFWLVIGVLYVIAARNAVFDNNGVFVTTVWAMTIVLLWPFVYLLRLAGQVQRGDL